jgi:carbon storage regulator
MLVLSRKAGEDIVIPMCGLTVTVLGIQGRRVRLGISAPAQINVVPGELASEKRHLFRPERPATGEEEKH